MPLTRTSVTAASRIMLPAYAVVTGIVGLVYTLDPCGRLARVPALSYQRELLPMWQWGCVFLGVSAVMIVAFASRRRALFVFALYANASAMVMWALLYLGSIFVDPAASLLAPVYPLFVATACHASAVSLLRGET